MKYTDPSGHLLDIIFDIGSAIWDVVDIIKNPTSGWAWGSLGADVVCAFVPFVAGGGAAVRGMKIGTKAINAIDNTADMAKTINTVDNVVDTAKAVENTHDYAKTIGVSWDATGDGWKVGDPIRKLTSKGDVPSWSTVRQRNRKNEAYYRGSKYSERDLGRMRKGLARQSYNRETGMWESWELHHDPPQAQGGLFDVTPHPRAQHRQGVHGYTR